MEGAFLPDSPNGYQLEAEVARGGMGVVYQARDLSMNRTVAVKLLRDRYPVDSTGAKRFLEEVQITGQLQHPGIPPIYQVGTLADGRPFLAMKLIKGQTLEALLKANTPFNKLAVFEAVAQAVGYAHAHGIIHRDLKPANIMVGAFGEVQVMDWGLAKLLTADRQRGRLDEPIQAQTPGATSIHDPRSAAPDSHTQAGSMLGTPAYMAPEQAAGEIDKMDQRTDVFGLGGVLCALFTGQPPYVGQSVHVVGLAAVRGQTDEAFARLDACGAEPDVIALCKRCLAFEPGDRPADGNAVASKVAKLRAEAEERARQAEIEQAKAHVIAAEQRKRRRILQMAGSVIVTILLAGLGVSLWYMDQARRAEAQALADRNEKEAQRQKAADQEQKALAHAAAEQRARETTDAVLEFVEERVMASARPLDQEGGLGPDVKLADAIKSALPHLEETLQHQPLVEARLRRTMGRSFQLLGQADVAWPLHERSVELFTKHLGRDHPETLLSMSNLANDYADLGRQAEALALHEETLKRRKASLGPDHPETLRSMMGLANSLAALGRLAEALILREETVRLHRKKLGAEHLDTLASINNLAISYAALGRLAEARALYEETLEVRKVKLGPDHPDTLRNMTNLAVSYAVLGRRAEALALHEETLKLRKTKLGLNHPDTLRSMMGLANSYAALGRMTEAVALHEEALKLRTEKLGPDHPDTLLSMNFLAACYAALGRHTEALALQQESLKLRKEKLGPDHFDTLTTLGALGQSYRQAGKMEEALLHLEEAAQGLEKRRFVHPNAAYLMTQTTEGYEEAEQWERAEGWRRKWLAHVKEKQGPESNECLRELTGLATNLMKQKKFAEAEPLLLEAHGSWQKRVELRRDSAADTEQDRALLAAEKKRLVEHLDRLIELYTAWEKPDEVKKWQAEKEKLEQQ
ncbi:MAG TPA: serine/threonine-protein kinase [Gemmatales bacterium]|nr:serine/threonine-protein kinase [Gemmatales bacterium]